MNATEFLKEFEEALKTDPDISFYPSDAIRLTNKENTILCCPLTYLCRRKLGEHLSMGQFHVAGEKLDLGRHTSSIIAYSADNVYAHDNFRSSIREQLLKIIKKKKETLS